MIFNKAHTISIHIADTLEPQDRIVQCVQQCVRPKRVQSGHGGGLRRTFKLGDGNGIAAIGQTHFIEARISSATFINGRHGAKAGRAR